MSTQLGRLNFDPHQFLEMVHSSAQTEGLKSRIATLIQKYPPFSVSEQKDNLPFFYPLFIRLADVKNGTPVDDMADVIRKVKPFVSL